MKIGNIPLASIVLILFSLASFAVKYFLPSQRTILQPYLDGALVGAMLVFALYYANIYFGAWLTTEKRSLTTGVNSLIIGIVCIIS